VYNASRIAVNLFSTTLDQVAQISLDNHIHDIPSSFTQQPTWTSDILDPSVPHTIQVIKQTPSNIFDTYGAIIALDSFLVTSGSSDPSALVTEPQLSIAFPPPTVPNRSTLIFVTEAPTEQPVFATITIQTVPHQSTSASTTETATEQHIATTITTPTVPNHSTPTSEIEAPIGQSDGQSGLSISAKVGIAMAIVAVCIGLLGALWIYRKRKNHESTLNQFSTVVTPVSQSSDTLYAGTRGVPPIMGRGGVDMLRKSGGGPGLLSVNSAPPAYSP